MQNIKILFEFIMKIVVFALIVSQLNSRKSASGQSYIERVS